MLLGSLTSVWSQGKVLVPGEPPLTRDSVDLYQQMWEWYCDVKLTPEQRRQHTQHFVAWWKKRNKASNQQLLTGYRVMENEWRDILGMKEPEQGRKRAQLRDRWLAVLRKSPDGVNQFLVGLYDAAYRPGGPKNPIVVAGSPPLTQAIVARDQARVELVLDLLLSDDQGREYQRLLTADWKQWDQNERREWAKRLDEWADVLAWNSYRRDEVRALAQVKFRQRCAKGSESGRWVLTLDKAASTPGSAQNPILVEGEPPLTQLVVNRYAEYLEILVDLSVSGGFTPDERQILHDYLLKGWRKRDTTSKQELLADLGRWAEAAGQGAGKAEKFIRAVRPKLLAQLRTAREDALSQWLLAVHQRETELHQQNMAYLKRRHEMNIATIKALPEGPTGRWEPNPRTGRLEWVR
jgi:hypothetical protein